MRDTSKWRQKLTFRLRDRWQSTETSLNPAMFCDIELGLYLMSQLAPATPARALWALLTGYPFAIAQTQHWSKQHYQMLGNARYILTQFRSEYSWKRALGHYRQIDELLRGYDIDEALETFYDREISFCSDRKDIYAKALQQPLPHRKESVRWADAGRYQCSDRGYRISVEIPDDLVFPPPPAHNLAGRTERQAITVTWEDLIQTARWMDTQFYAKWEERLSRVRLELFGEDGITLSSADTLTVDGLMHLIGMVSSGKSTLMDVLAVYGAKNNFHVTLVIGDVIGALNRAKLFTQLGISVAPILGASNRERHTNRLHRAWNAENPLEPLNQEHPGFRWLSTACPLSELRRDVANPFQISKYPCQNLYSTADEDEVQPNANTTYVCPIYSACPFHQAQRDLVEAKIWIATPASLVYTRVAKQINSEQIRFAELVFRHSDLIIVDEADQVQVQLDSLFSPSQTLMSRGREAWLSRIQQQVVQQLNQEGRGQLADLNVDGWCKVHDIAQTVTSRIYALILSQKPALREWSEKGDYFTDWLILEQVAIALSGASKETRDSDPGYLRLRQLCDLYLNDPLGDNSTHPLSELTRQLITTANEDLVRQHLNEWINQNKESSVTLTDQELKNVLVRLEFALLVAVLSNRLNSLLRDWKNVETPLKLEGESSLLFHTPPSDYEAIIPAAPMGNVLAFQYVKSTENGSGDLRFFKCLGVGRWLLLHLHELFASDGIVGPHVLLLSGTSWAGKAPGYHVQIPVAGVLHSPEAELQAIQDSYFEFMALYDKENRPITVSGAKGHGRAIALKEMLNQLSQPSGLGGPSRLEVERNQLPEGRQRVLLLVGSYEQAKLAQEHLETLRSDWRGQILRLVPDDDEFDSQWRNNESSLQRNLVDKFARTGSWILIAPLMAIERGHNILNEEDKAAIGAAYFLVRPHPRPDDISYAIHSINRWAIEHYANLEWLTNNCENGLLTLDRVGNTFRDAAYKRWRYLLRLPMIYSTLPHNEREAVTWNQLVSIWQVIGRLIRGGSPARVFFCDAAFARRTAFQDEQSEEPQTSLLVSIKEVLRPYFIPGSNPQIADRDRELVQALYGPFYTAIEQIGGIAE